MKTLRILSVLLVAAAIAGGYFFPKITLAPVEAIGSAVGTTFGSAKVAQVNMTPSTASATSTAILNTDSFDRVIDSTFYSCTGVGTSFAPLTGAGLVSGGLTITAATSSTVLVGATTNVNTIMANIVSTTTAPLSYMASSTVTVLPARIWLSGSYMNFQFNATNTAACTVGAYYHGS